MRSLTLLLLSAAILHAAGEDDYKPGPDSLPQPGVAKGEMLKDTHTAAETSVFPGTVRDYQIYLPPGLDKTRPAPFMVFQDGVIYQAPVVFDNLIAKKVIPPLIGIFIRPGVVPAVNDNALPRFNRSYEYDSVTDTYARFLINEFLPAITKKHGLNLSTDPNDRAIAGSSSGGICAFMVAWHRPDAFRRVFTSVGTYVGIHGADQLPVLVRKFEPKPIKIFLQSGENDNNLYCGDWWMANQMMERSLTWAGYDVAHAWGTGGHNQKHATAIFPDVMRWLWKGWPEAKEVKANPRGDSKWRGYEVVESNSAWDKIAGKLDGNLKLAPNKAGEVFISGMREKVLRATPGSREPTVIPIGATAECSHIAAAANGMLASILRDGSDSELNYLDANGGLKQASKELRPLAFVVSHNQWIYTHGWTDLRKPKTVLNFRLDQQAQLPKSLKGSIERLAFSPDQSQLFSTQLFGLHVRVHQVVGSGAVAHEQEFAVMDVWPGQISYAAGMCVDTEGRLYVATAPGIQVCDQAGRVNFIIPTPDKPLDVCLGGKDLSELFIACGDAIYKRPTKAKGYISGQMAPIKPAPPKL